MAINGLLSQIRREAAASFPLWSRDMVYNIITAVGLWRLRQSHKSQYREIIAISGLPLYTRRKAAASFALWSRGMVCDITSAVGLLSRPQGSVRSLRHQFITSWRALFSLRSIDDRSVRNQSVLNVSGPPRSSPWQKSQDQF